MTTPVLDSSYPPPRRRGLVVHITGAVLLAGLVAASIWLALQQPVGSYSILLLLLSLALVFPFGLFMYRGYALLRAGYTLERDGLRLRWGLRAEDIPLPDVEWVRPASDMGFSLPLPLLRFPGAILGRREVEGLGPVEYMASETSTMLLVATPEKIFAISPRDPKAFTRAFQRAIEMGSLSPISSQSTLPAAFLERVWTDRPARTLILTGLVLTAALFVLVTLIIPTRSTLPLGFDRNAYPMPPGPSERLLLLPVLGAFMYFADLIAGLFFYRGAETQPTAYLLWAASIVTPCLLIIATLFLV